MRFRPILFSTPMVQAILEGRKTQTRRVVKGSDDHYYQSLVNHATGKHTFVMNGNYSPKDSDVCEIKCPYGQPGDVIWVRETFAEIRTTQDGDTDFVYKADYKDGSDKEAGIVYKPSIHMPKAAARIWLKITNIRVERVQDISEDDATKEGIERLYYPSTKSYKYKDYLNKLSFWNTPEKSFKSLWKSINGEQSWNDNPWVWVVEFERIEKPENFIS